MIPKPLIKTKDELDSFLSFLNIISSSVYKDAKLDVSSIKQQFGKNSWWDEGFVSLVTQMSKEVSDDTLKELKNLENDLKELERVSLSMSFIPSAGFAEKAYDTLKNLLNKDFVIDVKIEETIPSGAKLFYMGKYIDLTAKTRVINLLKSEDVLGKYL